jgi:hypothetical protein
VLVVAPTFGTYGSDYTLSYTFSNGFSGFGAGVPGSFVLPLTITNFEGQANHGTVLLNWNTSNEINTKNFNIEKSVDGSNYYVIGTVNASGNSNSIKKYSFTDANPGIDNYYRLHSYDVDGSNKLSKVVRIRMDNINQNIFVVNNPFHNNLTVRMAVTPQQKISCELTSVSGAVILKQEYSPSSVLQIDLSHYPVVNGIYTLKMLIDNKVYVRKVIRQ